MLRNRAQNVNTSLTSSQPSPTSLASFTSSQAKNKQCNSSTQALLVFQDLTSNYKLWSLRLSAATYYVTSSHIVLQVASLPDYCNSQCSQGFRLKPFCSFECVLGKLPLHAKVMCGDACKGIFCLMIYPVKMNHTVQIVLVDPLII